MQAQSHRSSIAERILAILLACLPLGWIIGLLPPPRALVGWALEQYGIIVLGSSFAASDAASLLQACLGTLAAGVTYALWDETSLVGVAAFAAIVGCLLSMDVWSAAQRLLVFLRRKVCHCISGPKMWAKKSINREFTHYYF